MITGTNLDRRFWIGASDTDKVIGNQDTQTWKKWWALKTGLFDPDPTPMKNVYTLAGDIYEKPIARFYGEDITEDRTIHLPEYSLRVNLDADTGKKIIECKTFKEINGRLTDSNQYNSYYRQVQSQLFSWKETYGEIIGAEIRVYYMRDEDYEAARNGHNLPLDESRLESVFVPYDEVWVENFYLPKLKELGGILKKLRRD